MESRSCPRCELTLVACSIAGERGAITVDLCVRGCGGAWLDADDMRHGPDLLEALQEGSVSPRLEPSIARVDRTHRTSCPVCREMMRRYRWNYNSPVILDQCPDGHGTWLDAGEAEEMRAFQEHEVISPVQKARLRAQLEIARMEIQTRARRADRAGRLPHPCVQILEHLWGLFL